MPLRAGFTLYEAAQKVVQSGELSDDRGRIMLSLESKPALVSLLLRKDTELEQGLSEEAWT